MEGEIKILFLNSILEYGKGTVITPTERKSGLTFKIADFKENSTMEKSKSLTRKSTKTLSRSNTKSASTNKSSNKQYTSSEKSNEHEIKDTNSIKVKINPDDIKFDESDIEEIHIKKTGEKDV